VFEGRWQPPELPPELPAEPVDALVAAHTALGVEPDWATAGARWKREEDIPLEVMLGVSEALLVHS
jgi:hypothetical protein